MGQRIPGLLSTCDGKRLGQSWMGCLGPWVLLRRSSTTSGICVEQNRDRHQCWPNTDTHLKKTEEKHKTKYVQMYKTQSARLPAPSVKNTRKRLTKPQMNPPEASGSTMEWLPDLTSWDHGGAIGLVVQVPSERASFFSILSPWTRSVPESLCVLIAFPFYVHVGVSSFSMPQLRLGGSGSCLFCFPLAQLRSPNALS